jgi:hypothetical protein
VLEDEGIRFRLAEVRRTLHALRSLLRVNDQPGPSDTLETLDTLLQVAEQESLRQMGHRQEPGPQQMQQGGPDRGRY